MSFETLLFDMGAQDRFPTEIVLLPTLSNVIFVKTIVCLMFGSSHKPFIFLDQLFFASLDLSTNQKIFFHLHSFEIARLSKANDMKSLNGRRERLTVMGAPNGMNTR